MGVQKKNDNWQATVERARTRGGGFSDTFIAFLDHNSGQYIIRCDMLGNNIIRRPTILLLSFGMLFLFVFVNWLSFITFLYAGKQQIITLPNQKRSILDYRVAWAKHILLLVFILLQAIAGSQLWCQKQENCSVVNSLACCHQTLPSPLLGTQSVTNRLSYLFNLFFNVSRLHLLLLHGFPRSVNHYQFTIG